MPRMLEIGFAASLALTLSIKVMTGATASDEGGSQLAVEDLLKAQGFAIGEPEPHADPPLIPAARSDCTLRFTDVSALGWHRDVLAGLRKPDERLYFVIDGKVFDRQPRWRTFAKYVMQRVGAYSGVNIGGSSSLLGVIAGPECGPGSVDWRPVADMRG